MDENIDKILRITKEIEDELFNINKLLLVQRDNWEDKMKTRKRNIKNYYYIYKYF